MHFGFSSDARSINKDKLFLKQVVVCVYGITGGAGNIADDGSFFTYQCIKQG